MIVDRAHPIAIRPLAHRSSAIWNSSLMSSPLMHRSRPEIARSVSSTKAKQTSHIARSKMEFRRSTLWSAHSIIHIRTVLIRAHRVRPKPLPCPIPETGTSLSPYTASDRPKPVLMWSFACCRIFNKAKQTKAGTPNRVRTATVWAIRSYHPLASFIEKRGGKGHTTVLTHFSLAYLQHLQSRGAAFFTKLKTETN